MLGAECRVRLAGRRALNAGAECWVRLAGRWALNAGAERGRACFENLERLACLASDLPGNDYGETVANEVFA
jgi:hypothetical protein